ncbi:hypothetical protein BC834DRAFT_80703 [Gloeopeniophorella convolvens]|nr:hypothetical protein BC834DRAFT_80703 [Gloeopeniophorella convolvens]
MSRRLGSSALFAESMDTQAIPIPSNFTPAGDLPSIQQTGVPVPPTGSSGGTLDPRPHPGIPSAIDATPSSPHSIHTNSISDARRPFDGALSANSLILCGLEPIEPSQVKRYERGRNANENTPQKRKINAFQRHFATPVSYPGWERRLHPEGARYFTKANAGASLEILTDADVSVKPTRDKIEEAATQLKSKIEGQCSELRNAQMVLEVLDEDSIGYYLVDHDNKVLFWADPYDSSDASTLHEVSVIASEEQIGHEVEAWYWWVHTPRPPTSHWVVILFQATCQPVSVSPR